MSTLSNRRDDPGPGKVLYYTENVLPTTPGEKKLRVKQPYLKRLLSIIKLFFSFKRPNGGSGEWGKEQGMELAAILAPCFYCPHVGHIKP